MRSRFCFVFVIFCFTAVLIFTIYLRSANNRIFYKLYTCTAEQNRLKQQLWQKQLRLEGLINPAAVSRRLGSHKTGRSP
jgi:cytochrome c-type biogenesis protein CcmE